MTNENRDVVPDWAARSELLSAVRTSTLPHDLRHALRAFADYVNQPDGLERVWVARSVLKNETGMSSRLAHDVIGNLEKLHVLVVVEPGRGRRATRYRICLEKIPRRCASDLTVRSRKEVASDLTVRSQEQGVSNLTSPASDLTSTGSDLTVRPERKNVGTHPRPLPAEQVPADVIAILGQEGVSAMDVMAVIAIASEDPTTISPHGRLRASPSFRLECIRRHRDHQRAARQREREAKPRCEICNLPISDCDLATSRNPAYCDGSARRRRSQ